MCLTKSLVNFNRPVQPADTSRSSSWRDFAARGKILLPLCNGKVGKTLYSVNTQRYEKTEIKRIKQYFNFFVKRERNGFMEMYSVKWLNFLELKILAGRAYYIGK